MGELGQGAPKCQHRVLSHDSIIRRCFAKGKAIEKFEDLKYHSNAKLGISDG